MDYIIDTAIIDEPDVDPDDFIIGIVWGELPEDNEQPPQAIVEKSSFNVILTEEEINIIALIMVHSWL